jgi:serine/threonine protein kinase
VLATCRATGDATDESIICELVNMKVLDAKSVLQGRYIIDHLIGKGGMGEVYLAVDKRLGHQVALKRTFFTDDEVLAAAFEREARTLASLRHPVLPKVSDHFTENAEQFLVMEYIAGEDLSKRIELSKKAFPMNWVLFWADELLEALAYLHSQNPSIIHRDIKPQNLKLTSDNHIILLDFGLAKNNAGAAINSTGSVVGYTPHYASMEQIRGLGTTPQSDIYSLSATLYQLLTNVIPPDALKRADDIVNGRPDSIAPLFSLNPTISVAISDVILRGMALRAPERFANAREMQKALREAYASVQDVANANADTVAFSVGEQQPQSQMNTEQFVAPGIPLGETAGMNVQDFDTSNVSISPAPELGATISVEAYHEPVSDKTEVMVPIGDKTEVMPPIGEKTEVLPNFLTMSPGSTVTPNGSNETPEHLDNVNATVPFISFDNKTDSVVPEANFSENIQSTFTPPPFVAEEVSVVSQPTIQPKAKKKSSSFAFAILGGIGLLGVLLIGGGFGAWYYIENGGSAVAVDPTPKPTPISTPSPEPTIEVNNPDSNSSTVESNSNSGSLGNSQVSTPTPTPEIVDTKATPIDKPTPGNDKPVATPVPVKTVVPTTIVPTTPRPTPVVTVSQKPPVTPKPKTPKPTPTKGGRTDILQ